MKPTTLSLHTKFQIGQVDPRMFGGFLEHMGRCVYEGVYHPASAHADENGFRSDSLTALKRLQMTAMRYPGGNFASGYHWMDGIGPKQQRPTVRDLAWQSIEPNQFGTDEYIQLCRSMGWTPMLTVNLGTGTPEEARNWVEYCNSPVGTTFADMRAANGNIAPHHVKLWCLGNEMDGSWQLGHVPAGQYAIRAQQAAKMMKDTDRRIELVACGSCTIDMDTYMAWDHEVLDYLGDYADYVSLHRYVGNHENDTANYLAITNSIDRQIEEMDAVCRFIQAIFYPFEMFSRRREGVSLQTRVEGPSYESESYGRVHMIDASAILGENKLHLFLSNRSLDKSAEVQILLADDEFAGLDNAEILTGSDPKQANSFAQPDQIASIPFDNIHVVPNQATAQLPPLSFVAMTLFLN